MGTKSKARLKPGAAHYLLRASATSVSHYYVEFRMLNTVDPCYKTKAGKVNFPYSSKLFNILTKNNLIQTWRIDWLLIQNVQLLATITLVLYPRNAFPATNSPYSLYVQFRVKRFFNGKGQSGICLYLFNLYLFRSDCCPSHQTCFSL